MQPVAAISPALGTTAECSSNHREGRIETHAKGPGRICTMPHLIFQTKFPMHEEVLNCSVCSRLARLRCYWRMRCRTWRINANDSYTTEQGLELFLTFLVCPCVCRRAGGGNQLFWKHRARNHGGPPAVHIRGIAEHNAKAAESTTCRYMAAIAVLRACRVSFPPRTPCGRQPFFAVPNSCACGVPQATIASCSAVASMQTTPEPIRGLCGWQAFCNESPRELAASQHAPEYLACRMDGHFRAGRLVCHLHVELQLVCFELISTRTGPSLHPRRGCRQPLPD